MWADRQACTAYNIIQGGGLRVVRVCVMFVRLGVGGGGAAATRQQ